MSVLIEKSKNLTLVLQGADVELSSAGNGFLRPRGGLLRPGDAYIEAICILLKFLAAKLGIWHKILLFSYFVYYFV
jgi:hypothetical protein